MLCKALTSLNLHSVLPQRECRISTICCHCPG